MWLELCEKEAALWKVEGVIRLLEAFPRPRTATVEAVPQFSSFDELERHLWDGQASRAQRATEFLTAEVGLAQAEMFVGRYTSLCRFLQGLAPERPEARFLAVGLHARLSEILVDGTPYVIRVRGLVDYIYSRSAMVDWKLRTSGERLPSVSELFRQVTYERLAKGIRHATLDGPTRDGPVHMDLLRIDQGKARFLAKCVSEPGASRPLHQWVADLGGVAGFTGGFFLYSEMDIQPPSSQFDPVGLLVSGGEVLNPPTLARPAFFQDERGYVGFSRFGMKGVLIRAGTAGQVRVAQVNPTSRKFEAPACFTRAFGQQTPPLPGAALTVVGRQVISFHQAQAVAIPVNGFVLAFPVGQEWTALGQNMAQHGALQYELPFLPGFKTIVDAMAGGPTLLGHVSDPLVSEAEEFGGQIPPVTLANDETRDQNLLPRLAVGITPTFEVLILSVDGRNLSKAFGATLSQMAHWMRTLGASQAINLDGGSSKRMSSAEWTYGYSSEGLVDGDPSPESVRRLSSFFVVQEGHFSTDDYGRNPS